MPSSTLCGHPVYTWCIDIYTNSTHTRVVSPRLCNRSLKALHFLKHSSILHLLCCSPLCSVTTSLEPYFLGGEGSCSSRGLPLCKDHSGQTPSKQPPYNTDYCMTRFSLYFQSTDILGNQLSLFLPSALQCRCPGDLFSIQVYLPTHFSLQSVNG